MDALFQDGKHLREGLQCPLAHFLVGILKPWGKSIKDLLKEKKSRVHGNAGLAGVGWDNFCIPESGTQTYTNTFPMKKSSSQKGTGKKGETDMY